MLCREKKLPVKAVDFASRLTVEWIRSSLSPVSFAVLLCVASGEDTRAAVRNRTGMNGGNCLVVLRHLVSQGYLRFEPPVYMLQPMAHRYLRRLFAFCILPAYEESATPDH